MQESTLSPQSGTMNLAEGPSPALHTTDLRTYSSGRSLRDVVYLGWQIAPSYSTVCEPKCGGWGGHGVSANEYSCAHWAQKNFDLTPYLMYSSVWCNKTVYDRWLNDHVSFPFQEARGSDQPAAWADLLWRHLHERHQVQVSGRCGPDPQQHQARYRHQTKY